MRSSSGGSATRRRTDSENFFPITAAVWSTCFSVSDSRSMRAARRDLTVPGISRASIGFVDRRSFRPAALRDLETEAALSDASLADDSHYLGVTRGCALARARTLRGPDETGTLEGS